MDRNNKRWLKSRLLGGLGVEGAEVTVDPEVETIEEGDTASAAATDGVNEQVAVDAANEETEALHDAVEAGEEVQAALEAAVAGNRPLNKIEAAALKLTMQQVTKRFIGKADHLLPAQESFGGTHDRVEQTVLATEAVKETFKEFWEALKAQFMKVINAIRTAVKGFFDKAAATAKRAEAVRSRAETTSGNPTNGKITVNTGDISIGGEVSGAKLITGVTALADTVESTIKVKAKEDMVKEVNTTLAALEQQVEGKGSIESLVKDSNSTIITIYKALSFNTGKTAPPQELARLGDGAEATNVLPGERVVAFVPGQGLGRGAFNYMTVVGVKSGKGETTKEVPVLAPAEVIKIADQLIEANEIIVSYNQAFLRNEQVAAIFTKGVDKLISRVNKSDTGAGEISTDTSKAFKLSVDAISNYVRRQEAFTGSLLSYVNVASNGALNYCEKSLNEYKAA